MQQDFNGLSVGCHDHELADAAIQRLGGCMENNKQMPGDVLTPTNPACPPLPACARTSPSFIAPTDLDADQSQKALAMQGVAPSHSWQ
jgi:hypothetical protein